MGGYSEGERLGVPDAVAPAFAASLAAHRAAPSPCSNTGRILTSAAQPDAPAFVDFLKYTLRGVRRFLAKVPRHSRNAWESDGLEDLRAILFDTAEGGWHVTSAEQQAAAELLEKIGPADTLPEFHITGAALERGLACFARIMLEAHAPSLVFGTLTGRGIDGYRDHLKIYTHLGEICGHIAVGGNRDTVHVSLTGQACQRIDMPGLADAIGLCDYKLGRVDAAWDDFDGRYGTPADAATNYLHGGFTPARGARSTKVLFFDDMGSGAGSTFQLGDRSGRLLRIYAKGQQLGDKSSRWTRYEVQYMGAEFTLTLDHLRNPGILLTQYPDLSHLPVDGDGDAAMRVQREAEISVERVAQWLATTCGAALTLLADAIGPTTTCDLIRNEKTPARLKRLGNSRAELSELVATALTDQCKFAPIASTRAYHSAVSRGPTQ